MTQATKHWTILGAGAVGHLLACQFARQDIPSTLIARSKSEFQHSKVNYHFNDSIEQLVINYQSINKLETIECLLLTVKSYQVEQAILSIRKYLTSTSQIFLLQNGMGTIEKVTQLLTNTLPQKQIYPGTNTHGVYLRKEPSGRLDVIHAGIGQLVFGNNFLVQKITTGENTGEIILPECLEHLQNLALNTSWTKNIAQKLWLKLAVNAAINPLTAVNNCLNGTLLQSEKLKVQLDLLCEETAELFNRMGIDIKKNELYEEVHAVVTKTAANKSSMLQDINSGKRTEIEAITGYLLKKADKFNVPMKAHHKLYCEITAII